MQFILKYYVKQTHIVDIFFVVFVFISVIYYKLILNTKYIIGDIKAFIYFDPFHFLIIDT